MILPILKYFSIKKRVTASATTSFLLKLFEKIETVKKMEVKTKIKNMGIIPIVPGSANKTTKRREQRKIIDIKIFDNFIV